MKRRLCILLAIALLGAGTAMAASGGSALRPVSWTDGSRGMYGWNSGQPGTYVGSLTVVLCEEWVSLRESPSTFAERIAQVPLWAEVEAYVWDDTWTECVYRGQRGYILSEYLTDRPAKFPNYPY